MNLADVRAVEFFTKEGCFDRNWVAATLLKEYCYPKGEVAIRPFIPEMVKANNVSLFIDDKFNILGGQIGRYTEDEGLNVVNL